MHVFRSLIVILVLASSSSFAQVASDTDSLKIMARVHDIFDVLDRKDKKAFTQLSTSYIYCIPCFRMVAEDGSYEIKRDQFFKKYLLEIANWQEYKKAKLSKEVFFAKGDGTVSDLVVFFNVLIKDTNPTEHDKLSFGIHLKKSGDEYMFSGLETVP